MKWVLQVGALHSNEGFINVPVSGFLLLQETWLILEYTKSRSCELLFANLKCKHIQSIPLRDIDL